MARPLTASGHWQITWPDIQFIFRQMLPQIKDKNDNVLLEPTNVPMLNPRVRACLS